MNQAGRIDDDGSVACAGEVCGMNNVFVREIRNGKVVDGGEKK